MKECNRFGVLAIVMLVIGCDRKTLPPDSTRLGADSGKAHPDPILLVKSGMTLNEMTDLFGSPISSNEHFGRLSMRFTFADFTNIQTRSVGVTVWIDSERVDNFAPIIGDLPPHRPIIGKHYYASVRLESHLSILDLKPKAITPSELYGTDQPFVRKAVIDLDAVDVERVKEFSATNFGNKIKVYLNGEYVEDLFVPEPIEEAQFEIVFRQTQLPLSKLYNVDQKPLNH